MLLGIYFFLLGLIIGSFLNVVIVRGEHGEGLGGRSHCPRCWARIAWYDNIPLLSHLLLLGKCRECRASISLHYPLIEFMTGATFALIGMALFPWPRLSELEIGSLAVFLEAWPLFITLGLFWILVSCLIVLLVADMHTMTMPLTWLMGAVGVALLIVTVRSFIPTTQYGLSGPWLPHWLSLVWGGAVASVFFLSLVWVSRETWMGMGDVWIAAALGFSVGIESLLFALTLSFSLGAAAGLGFILFKRKGLKSQLPFAPFLVVATLLVWSFQWFCPEWLEYVVLPAGLFS